MQGLFLLSAYVLPFRMREQAWRGHVPTTRRSGWLSRKLHELLSRDNRGHGWACGRREEISLELEILNQVNAERTRRGLHPLKLNTLLRYAARSYAVELAAVPGRLSHTGIDGRTVFERVAASGYLDPFFSIQNTVTRSYAVGENLARGWMAPTMAVSGWMASPAHRTNILNPDFEETGVGVVGDCWVQVFGRVTH